MEPRPPRPRTPQPPFPGGAAPAAYPGAPAAGSAGYDGYPYAPAGTAPPAPLGGELLPRQERRRQQAWRGVAVFVLALALIAGLGYAFSDTLLPRGPAPSPTAPAGPALAASPAATPTAAVAIANLLATATPTPAPAQPTSAPTATPGPAAAGASTSDAGAASDQALVPLVDLLPTTADVPDGLTLVTTDERSESEVVASLGGTDEDARLLSDWGWEGNAFNDFTGSTANGTYALNVSIHRFADDASADDALIYFSDKIVGEASGYSEAEIEPLGDAVRLLVGTPAGDPTSVIYMRDGSVMYRIGGTAAADVAGDPTADVIAVAQALLAR